MAKKNKKEETKEEFFVPINDGAPIRISLLESTKNVLEAMKLFQSIKEIRKEKLAERKRLRTQLRLVYSSINKIKCAMPYIKLPEETKPVPKKIVTQTPKVIAIPPRPIEKPKPLTELERIEQGLKEIEEKLANVQ